MPHLQADAPSAEITALDAENRRLYADLVRDYSRPVFDYMWRMVDDRALAEDLSQDVFVTALTHIGELRYPDRARSWLFAIAANRLRHHFRRARLIHWLPIEAAHKTNADHRGLSATTIAVQGALRQLTAEDREILVLCGYCGFKAAEAAESLGISTDALAKRWQRARRRFSEIMERGDT